MDALISNVQKQLEDFTSAMPLTTEEQEAFFHCGHLTGDQFPEHVLNCQMPLACPNETDQVVLCVERANGDFTKCHSSIKRLIACTGRYNVKCNFAGAFALT